MAHWQLLLDDWALERATGFDRVVHHPRDRGVVIPADQPWETGGASPGFVGRAEDGSFFACYTAMWWDLDRGERIDNEGFRKDRAHHLFSGLAWATSQDGIHWEKPELGLVEAPSGVDRKKHAPFPTPQGYSRRNNLGVPFTLIADLGQYGNVADPQRRYALRLAQSGGDVGASHLRQTRGYFAPRIPDFLNDPRWQEQLIDSGGEFNPRRHALHFWDEVHEEWVAMDQGVVPHWLPSREIGRFASKDLLHWSSTAALYPDPADPHLPHCYDEPMSLTPFYAEGVVFGLLSWFHSDRTHPDGGPVLEPTPAHPHRWPWCRKGTNEMRITLSRDGGKSWDRTSSREAWIPHGTEEHSYDRLVIGALPPVRVGDEDWFYALVIDGDHLVIRNNPEQSAYYADRLTRHQIALYTQKRNRYVSLRAGHQPEVLITRSFVVEGEALQLNLDASRGWLRAALAPAGPVDTALCPSTAAHVRWSESGGFDRLLPGFGFGDGEVVRGDHPEVGVRFRGDLGSLRGQPVRLLLEMADADLYGFRFA
jgi:hypothetical protein